MTISFFWHTCGYIVYTQKKTLNKSAFFKKHNTYYSSKNKREEVSFFRKDCTDIEYCLLLLSFFNDDRCFLSQFWFNFSVHASGKFFWSSSVYTVQYRVHGRGKIFGTFLCVHCAILCTRARKKFGDFFERRWLSERRWKNKHRENLQKNAPCIQGP